MVLPNPPAEIYVPVRVDLTRLTDEDKAAFVHGWENTGGYTGDRDCQCPPDAIWCMPWTYDTYIYVHGGTMEEHGCSYWLQCKDEIAELLAAEAAAAE